MTIPEFIKAFGLASESLVLKWIEDELIPGATKDSQTQKYSIPECALPPYTKARAKTTDAICKSIVKGCMNRRYVSAKLYKISEIEFQEYIRQLAQANIISIVEENGIPYYYATLKSHEFMKSKNPSKFIQECLSTIAEATVKGAVSALFQN